MLLDASMLCGNVQALGTSAVICMLRMLCSWLQVLADLRYAEAHGPSVQHSSSHLGTRGSSGQGHSPSVYPSSPKASTNLVDMSRGEPGQSCSPSVHSSLPQGMPFGGTLEGSGRLDNAASLAFSPAAAAQLTHQRTPAALGTAAQRDRNASFGESPTAVGQQLTTDPVRQYDSKPLTNDCARPLSHQSLQKSSGSASAAVTNTSKKRAAEVSCAEPGAKQLTVAEGGTVLARHRRQGTTAAGGAFGHVGEATAVAGGGAGCTSYAAVTADGDADKDGDTAMADGEPKGRRRIVKLKKKDVTRAVGDQGYHGGGEVQAEGRC